MKTFEVVEIHWSPVPEIRNSWLFPIRRSRWKTAVLDDELKFSKVIDKTMC